MVVGVLVVLVIVCLVWLFCSDCWVRCLASGVWCSGVLIASGPGLWSWILGFVVSVFLSILHKYYILYSFQNELSA